VLSSILEILGNGKHTPENKKQELVSLLKAILEQKYLQFSSANKTKAQQREHPPQQS
jgi:hypothetical protein